ncbi:MAG TPA: hypothetical protein VJL81_05825 [Solirubrobacterales bacterium]|nr:hypothetical protein [Solirubrobacterales bacterium]
MPKLSVALVVALACLSCFATAAGAAPAPTKVTIQSYPEGVYGYVSSPAKACGAKRQVVVFEQIADQRDPSSDPRVVTGRSGPSEGGRYQWSAKTDDAGNFYAQAMPTKGCGSALSGVALGVGQDSAAAGPSYPPCSPYSGEGTAEYCDLGQIHYALTEEGFLEYCRFGSSSGNCPGRADGLFPWGKAANGASPGARIYWKPNGSGGRSVSAVSFYKDSASGEGVAFLAGTMPGPGSNRFTITEGWAQNEFGGNAGQTFKTLELPGRRPGEVGGPLDMNFVNNHDSGANAWISGFLYVNQGS